MKEKEWEKLLRIKTTGRDDTRSDTFRYPYEPTSYEVLERLANTGFIGKNNTLLDYGCGKGRVSIFMAYQTKCHSIGIEYDERIYNRALANKADTVSGNRVQFLCEDAVGFKIADNVDRFFFFNPFSIEERAGEYYRQLLWGSKGNAYYVLLSVRWVSYVPVTGI